MRHSAPSPRHHTLRYVDGTDLRDRKHRFTQVRTESWVAAEDARLLVPQPWGDLLEVVVRGEGR